MQLVKPHARCVCKSKNGLGIFMTLSRRGPATLLEVSGAELICTEGLSIIWGLKGKERTRRVTCKRHRSHRWEAGGKSNDNPPVPYGFLPPATQGDQPLRPPCPPPQPCTACRAAWCPFSRGCPGSTALASAKLVGVSKCDSQDKQGAERESAFYFVLLFRKAASRSISAQIQPESLPL